MGLYKYTNYEEYKGVQIAASKHTSDWVWVYEHEIETASIILLTKMGTIEFGICHGVRTGKEQEWFQKYLDTEVIGTDLVAVDTPGTLEWDFHEIKPEWEGNVDFIYSNSFDHTYAPDLCLHQWMRCLKPNGYCILHWSEGQLISTRRDPFGATLDTYKSLIERGGYELEDVSKLEKTRTLLWIQNKEK
jgi:hypothetical protein